MTAKSRKRITLVDRLRDTAGFSFTEMLVTVVIVVLATGMVGATMPAAMRAYRSVVDTSNAQVLVSTAATVLRDKLDKASDVEVKRANPTDPDGALVSFVDGQTGLLTKLAYGEDAKTYNSSNGLTVVAIDARGKPLTAEGGDGTTPMEGAITPLIDQSDATKSLVVDCGSIKFNEVTKIFTIDELKVLRDGKTVAELPTLKIRQMNEGDER